MNKKRIKIACIFLFISIWSIKAQSDYREGYIINNKKDTIYGLISYKGSKSNAIECDFKKDQKHKKQFFSPQEIKAYRFLNSKYFVSKIIKKDGEEIQVFLEYLVNGILNMYFLRDNEGEHYYVGNEEGELRELRNNEQEKIIDGKTYNKKSNEYKGVLKYTFKNSPSIVKKIDHLELDHKSLIKLTKDYHNELCTTGEQCIVFEKEKIKNIHEFGILLGLNILTPLKINSNTYSSKVENDEFDYGYYPKVGAFYKINFPFIDERLYFYFEGAYQKANFKKNDITENDTKASYYHEYRMKLDQVSLLGALRYEFPKGKIRPVFELGLSYTVSLKQSKYSHTLYNLYDDGEKELEFERKLAADLSYAGFSLGVGCNFNYLKDKYVNLMLRYQRGSVLGVNQLFDFNSKISMFKLSVGFTLFE